MNKTYTLNLVKTASDDYIKDIKQTLIDKGVATEETTYEELSGIVENTSFLKTLLDARKTTKHLFYESTLTNVDDLIKFNDTSNVVSFYAMFENSKIVNGPLLNTSNVENMSNMYYWCKQLKYVKFDDTSKVKDASLLFQVCESLETVEGLDVIKCTNSSSSYNGGTNGLRSIVYGCKALKNFEIKNIGANLSIGSGSGTGYSDYGTKLTLDSLINTCKECIRKSSSRTLTVGTANIEKLSTVTVKFVDPTIVPSETAIAVGEKGDVVVCESTDEGAMYISEYMSLKNWTLA